jgi:2-oxoglutarate ferredoxin oxidoreductase subunit alpha
MSEKRERKLEMLKSELPEPTLYGSSSAQTVFVGYGSSKNALLDTIQQRDDIAYLHYDYIYPLKTNSLMKLIEEDKRLILIENNQGGQFGKLITEECAYQFKEKLLKYNGRSFSLEDILDYLDN